MADPLRAIRLNLIDAITRETSALRELRGQALGVCSVLPTDAALCRRVLELEDVAGRDDAGLDPSDATVLAAVLADLPNASGREARFVTTNKSDFFTTEGGAERPKPAVLRYLRECGCELLGTFRAAAGWAGAGRPDDG